MYNGRDFIWLTGRGDGTRLTTVLPSRPVRPLASLPSRQNTVIRPDNWVFDWRGSPQPRKPPNIVENQCALPICIRSTRRPADCFVHRIALSWFLQISIHQHFLREKKIHEKICAPLLYRSHACRGSVCHSRTFSRYSVARFQILQRPSCEVQKRWTLVSDSLVVVVVCSCWPSKGRPWCTHTTPSGHPTPINTTNAKRTCGEA